MQTNDKKRALYYGTRKTDKFVRCYWKSALGIFRVELELHSGLLRDIATLDDFLYLPDVVYPKHFQLVAFDWRGLEHYLRRKLGDKGNRIISGVKRRSPSLRRVRRYLDTKGIVNVHRFLVPLGINEKVSRALNRWAQHFKKGPLWVRTK